MNHQRFNSIYEGLSSVCQKVYAVVPIQESWTIQQIRAEADRKAIGATASRGKRSSIPVTVSTERAH